MDYGSVYVYARLSAKWPCMVCPRRFDTDKERKAHREEQHAFCVACKQHLLDGERGIMTHNQRTHPLCTACNQFFDNTQELDDHCSQYHADAYCNDCSKVFNSPHNLQQHLSSGIHQPRTVLCKGGCGQLFISHSHMLLHLEQGVCPSGISRADINARAAEYDTGNIIVKPGVRLIEERWIVSDDMFDARTQLWHCYLCNKTTRTRAQMQAHLDSPAHDAKLFHCPGRCGKETSMLSGMMQHIESRKCHAYAFIKQILPGRMRRLLAA